MQTGHLEGINDAIELGRELRLRPEFGGVRLNSQLVESILEGADMIAGKPKAIGARWSFCELPRLLDADFEQPLHCVSPVAAEVVGGAFDPPRFRECRFDLHVAPEHARHRLLGGAKGGELLAVLAFVNLDKGQFQV